MPELRYLFKQMLIRRLLIIAAFFLIILFLVPIFKDLWLPAGLKKLSNYLHLAAICGFISLISGLITRTLITLFRVKYFAVIRIVYLTLTLIIYLYLLMNNYRIKEILWATIITSFSAAVLYLFVCLDLLKGKTKKHSLKTIYKLGITIWTNDLLGYLLGKDLDIIIMTFYGVATSHIGLYQIAFTLIAYARMIITKGMTGILQSAFSSAFHSGGMRSLRNWWKMTMKFQIMAVAPGILFLILFAHQLFETLLPKYIGATVLLQTFGSFALATTFCGGGTHITAFYAIGKERIVLYTRILAGLINLLLDIFLIYYFGALGAIIATGISGLSIGLLELSLAFFNLRTNYPAIFLLKCLICLGFAGFIAFLTADSGIISLTYCGFIYFSVYSVSAWLVKPFKEDDIIRLSAVSLKLSRFLALFSTKSKVISAENL
jgi:O-antigen/teichoic acid export membrane protein